MVSSRGGRRLILTLPPSSCLSLRVLDFLWLFLHRLWSRGGLPALQLARFTRIPTGKNLGRIHGRHSALLAKGLCFYALNSLLHNSTGARNFDLLIAQRGVFWAVAGMARGSAGVGARPQLPPAHLPARNQRLSHLSGLLEHMACHSLQCTRRAEAPNIDTDVAGWAGARVALQFAWVFAGARLFACTSAGHTLIRLTVLLLGLLILILPRLLSILAARHLALHVSTLFWLGVLFHGVARQVARVVGAWQEPPAQPIAHKRLAGADHCSCLVQTLALALHWDGAVGAGAPIFPIELRRGRKSELFQVAFFLEWARWQRVMARVCA
mmetsp:Transcript_9712/g.24273  ORF Transcript_9712/g.24273 Transcript_9712/m.24273 type:complete len:325 (-) Transcript_9712:695-1669(-)